MHKYLLLLLLACAFLLAADEQSDIQVQLHGDVKFSHIRNYQYFIGDSPNWDAPEIQTDDWQTFDEAIRKHPHRGMFWLTFDLEIEVIQPPRLDWVYDLHMLAAQEVYWNDLLIGRNGVPSETKEDEIPGKVWTTYLIPSEQITTGSHTLRIRGSNHYRTENMKFLREGWIRPFNPEFRYVSLWSLIPSLFVSVAGIIGVYFLMLYFTDGKQWEHLVFFLLLENFMVLGYVIQWDHLVGYSYDWEWLNLTIEQITAISAAVLLPLYYLLKHKAPRPLLWIAGLAIVTFVLSLLYPQVQIMGWFGSFGGALCITLYFGWRNQQMLWWEALGLLLCLIGLSAQDFEDVFMYIPTLFSLILLTHAMAMQRRKKQLQDAYLLENQLRAELLRKHIQPHFLLNTLTSLMEWVETDVERSTEFIAELAQEFRLMASVSSQPLIDLETELELCRKHLAIMSLRLQKTCILKTVGISGTEQLPPAIFHTLIENAFSHNAYEENSIEFVLSRESLDDQNVAYVLSAPMAKQQTSAYRKLGTGTGRKYIEARLAQSFGRHWEFFEEINENHWVTRITVNEQKRKHAPTKELSF